MTTLLDSFKRNQSSARWIELARTFKYRNQRLPGARFYQVHFAQQRGLEIGGPSDFFRYVIPIYRVISGLDSVNFSSHTTWEGTIAEGATFHPTAKLTGVQYISEATDLSRIVSDHYSFVISSNCLEHIANPLRAIEEWSRVIAPGGNLLLILPNKKSNFDHRRPITSFGHLLADYEANTSEHDLTHLTEILELHDLSLDPWAGSLRDFTSRFIDNYSNRCLHHHVFAQHTVEAMFDFFRIELLRSDVTERDLIFLGKVHKASAPRSIE